MDSGVARKELADWAAARRESDEARGPLVRDAHAAGVSKQEIYEITGLARTTINGILREGIVIDMLRERARAQERPDEYYLAARDKVLAVVKELDPGTERFTGLGGIRLEVRRKMPLRIILLGIRRAVPGEEGSTYFTFERNGRVSLTGNRGIPLREAIAHGHDPWASRGELEELATQLEVAVPEGREH